MHRPDGLVSSIGRWGICALAGLSLAGCGGGGGAGGGSGASSGGSTGGGGSGGTTSTYSVGGTITGLSGSGLTLTDNGGNALTVPSGASTFTFTQSLSAGTAYAVAVEQQPSGESCSASAATGTVSANVTSVKIACVPLDSIGGAVSGLTQPGLVLELNGQYTQSVAANATQYTFSTQLATGSAYQVTVKTQPSGESCTVSGSSGTVSANVTNASVSCTLSSFTVSGTVSGLGASGLKLQDDSGGQTLAVDAGATQYAFSQSVPYGTKVQVIVTAQPQWQNCVPGGSNFSGPIISNITQDTFTCSTVANVTTVGASASPAFNSPAGLAVDAAGNLYVADSANNQIRKITPGGTVTVLAGTGIAGSADGAANVATFNSPEGVAVDSSGDVFVADTDNNEIREIHASSGQVTTVVSAAAGLFNPYGIAVDAAGTLYVADTGNNEIRKISTNGTVTTLAGSTTAGSADGTGAAASFTHPFAVAVNSAGDVYVADFGNNEIREITPAGVVTTIAGSTTAGSADGFGTQASFYSPSGIAVDAAGNVYVADTNNNEIRLISPNGYVMTLAGSTTAGDTNGNATAASFNLPFGLALSSSGTLYVGDFRANDIRAITP